MKFIFTAGTWDLYHIGHKRLLEDAKRQGDYLIVGVQKDPSVDRPEKNKPIETLAERMEKLSSIKYIDKLISYTTEADLLKLLKNLLKGEMIDLRVQGDDHKGKPFTGEELPIKIYYHKRKHNYSSTNQREKTLRKLYKEYKKEI